MCIVVMGTSEVVEALGVTRIDAVKTFGIRMGVHISCYVFFTK